MISRVLVFGREPSAGKVKTRLAVSIGDQATVRIYEVLLRNSLEAAEESGAVVELWLAETPSTAFRCEAKVPLMVQRGTSLGQRMADAFGRSFEDGAERVVLIGSDCPQITARHLRRALACLEDQPVVLGPAMDGGYWLVAQRAPGVDLFSGVPWSHPDTLRTTRQRLRGLGVDWSEIDSLRDLDIANDLEGILADRRTPPEMATTLRGVLSGN